MAGPDPQPDYVRGYINYVVYFSDESEYKFAIGLADSNTVLMKPSDMAEKFGMVEGTHFNTGGELNPDKGMYGMAPYGIPTVAPGIEILAPNASHVFVMWNLDNYIVPDQGGIPATSYPPGTGPDLILAWSANIVFQAASIDPEDEEIAPVPKRRWIAGFETQFDGAGSGSSVIARPGSRTSEGMGFTLRSNNNQTKSWAPDIYGPVTNPKKTWERMYLRVNKIGIEEVTFWSVSNQGGSGFDGIQLNLKDSGDGIFAVIAYNRKFNALTQLGGFLDTAGDTEFQKIDILYEYSTGAAVNGRFRLYVWSQLVCDVAITPTMSGLGANTTPSGTGIGLSGVGTGIVVTANNGWEFDIDDCHNAEIPNIAGVEKLTSIDWVLGTHIQAQKVNSAIPGTWVGPIQACNQLMAISNANMSSTTSQLTSSTSGAVFEGITDTDDSLETIYAPIGLYMGAAAVRVVTSASRASGSANSQLGYKIAGGAAVTTPIFLNTTVGGGADAFYPGNGSDIIPNVTPLSVVFVHSADAIQNRIVALVAEVQHIGIFGAQDTPPSELTLGGPTSATSLYLHNAHYPTIPQSFIGPISGPQFFAVVGGTYVGNGTTNVIQLPAPAHFLYIRPVGSANAGSFMMGAAMCSQQGQTDAGRPDLIVRTDFDPITGTTTFTVTGTSINNNQNAITYQWIAICDPGFRFTICGAYIHKPTFPGPSYNNVLTQPDDMPSAGLFSRMVFNSSSLVRNIYKGVGHPALTGNVVSSTPLTNVGEWLSASPIPIAGVWNGPVWASYVDAQDGGSNSQATYCFIKKTDQCDNVMFHLDSYTGNGVASRVLTFDPPSARYPLFVLVQPHNAVAYVRDPSDVGTSSRNFTSGVAIATAITAVGIDSITIGTTLNANGVIYDVFMILGSDAGMLNGMFYPSYCSTLSLVPDPEEPIADINFITDGGLIVGGQQPGPLTLLKDVSGIYTIQKDQHHDALIDRQTAQTTVDVKIPDPTFKTGYIGG